MNRAPADRHLFLAVVASWFFPGIAHPAMILHGQPGTGKTTTSKMIKLLVDPSPVLTGGIPREDRDIAMLFDQSWLACFDNLNQLKPWLSDILCRAITGEGKYSRQLYTDDTPILRQYQRCIMLNGIGSPVTRDDLLDRSVVICIEKPDHQKAETALMKGWANVLPGILGAFFSAISVGIRNLPSISEEQPFRMADFTRWGMAMAPGLGFTAEEFLSAYESSIACKWLDSVESSPFSSAVVTFLERHGKPWQGTATDLASELEPYACREGRQKPLFSIHPRWIAGELMRIAPALENYGILVERLAYKRIGGEIQRKVFLITKREWMNDE